MYMYPADVEFLNRSNNFFYMNRAKATCYVQVSCAPSDDSDRSVHSRSLISVFLRQSMRSQDPTGKPLISVFAAITCNLVGFAVFRHIKNVPLVSFFTIGATQISNDVFVNVRSVVKCSAVTNTNDS